MGLCPRFKYAINGKNSVKIAYLTTTKLSRPGTKSEFQKKITFFSGIYLDIGQVSIFIFFFDIYPGYQIEGIPVAKKGKKYLFFHFH